ncbi:hypothetical protein P168DRAFT_113312 [Aspergillus campestris IBT 28561]|uniref:Uncharacterized protein n=1 Tax=Aspergillus campestris (strain IBT 28561) TaxID=1392248 RepID=A0A2I1D9G0_ASPC2|nr:uncharacterized protein P168DRAFT_113312 [Aspergillus campestris IBT 28561]PKY06514.1 hypothetical protein P168DRAFT_113312 [Aspergillus campestris IBT 28561]
MPNKSPHIPRVNDPLPPLPGPGVTSGLALVGDGRELKKKDTPPPVTSNNCPIIYVHM